ncbi:sensor histidine kinase [Nonomuraea typhae]|uniref:histidine kinase n=1 Tax=Nonomuraea typhae TaxID=2603600 RepID=A0ABW7Z2P1_9ACTN
MTTGIRPWMLDALAAAVLFVLTLGPGQVLRGGPEFILFQVALLLPLVWRRTAPELVFAVISSVALVQWARGVQLPADVALLVALYTVGAHAPWRHTLVAAAVTEAGAVLASARWAPEGQFVLSVVALSVTVAAAALSGTAVRARREYVAALEGDRDRRARLAVAEERARTAREVHDIVTHNLSVMIALADSASYVREHSPDKAAAALEQISRTGRLALADMQRTLPALRPEPGPGPGPGHAAGADPGLAAGTGPGPGPDADGTTPGIAQLPGLAEQVRAAGLPVDLTVDGDPAPVPALAQLTVYRIVQEALTNALRHAPTATHVHAGIRLSPEAAIIEVTDQARTADGGNVPRVRHERAAARGGNGLRAMRERVAAYGGSLRAGPTPDGGWEVIAHLDLAHTP